MAEIRNLTRNGETFYPLTHEKAVIGMEDFKETIINQVDQYKPIEITGNVTNAPDEEDITSDSNNLLKFKNRNNLYGLGKVILRRGLSFASQITQANTIYVIQYNFDLENGRVNIPNGSILLFEGGTLSNGTLVCADQYDVRLVYYQDITEILSSVILEGNFIHKACDKDTIREILVDNSSITKDVNDVLSVKANGIQNSHLNSNVVDASSVALDSNNKISIKDGGVTGSKLNSAVVNTDDLSIINNKIQLANRGTTDGMGKIILRKDQSFASQLTQTNTIYVIRYNFTLTGDVTVPANCVLEFDGGSISGDGTNKNTITLNGALIDADNTVFHNIVITPEEKLVLNAKWFDATSDDTLLTMLINAVHRNSKLIIDRNFSITQPISSGVGVNGLLNTTIESPKSYYYIYSINIDYLPSNDTSPIKLYVQGCLLKNITIKDNNGASGAVNGDTALLELLPQYLDGAEGDTDIDGCSFQNNRCTNHLKVVGRGYRIMNCGFSGTGHVSEGVIRCVGKTNNEGSSEQPWDYPDVSMRRLTIRNNTCHSNGGFLVDISQDLDNVDTAFLNVSISNNTCDNGCRIIKTSSKIKGLNICNNTFLCVQAPVEEILKQVIDKVICYFNGNIDGLNFTNNIVNINPHLASTRNAEATLYFDKNYEFNDVNISDNIVNSSRFGFLVYAPSPNINGLNIKNNIFGKDAFVNGSTMSGARTILFIGVISDTSEIENLVITGNTSCTEYTGTIHAISGIGNLNLKNALIFGNMFTDNAIDGLTVTKTNVVLQSDIVNAS